MPPLGSGLLNPAPEFISSFDFADVLRGNSYLTLTGGYALREATTYESYTASSTGYEVTGTTADRIAQTFTIGNTGDNVDFWVTHIKLRMSLLTDLDLEIFAVDGDGKPTGAPLVRKSWASTEIKLTEDWVTFSLEDIGTIKLIAGTKYAIVATGVLRIFVDGSSPTYTGGEFQTSSDSGATWTKVAGKDMLFEVLGSLKNPLTLFTEAFTTIPTSNAILIGKNDTELFADRGSLDLDLEINKTATMEGLAMIECKGSLGGTDVWMYYVNEIYHVAEDGTETLIGKGQTTTGYHATSLTLDTTTGLDIDRKKFNRGEILRIKINAFAKLENIGNDGNKITFTWADFRALIPFRTFN